MLMPRAPGCYLLTFVTIDQDGHKVLLPAFGHIIVSSLSSLQLLVYFLGLHCLKCQVACFKQVYLPDLNGLLKINIIYLEFQDVRRTSVT